MILCFSYNPFRNDGIKNKSKVINTHRLICDRCRRYTEVLIKKGNPKLSEDIVVPKRWKVYNENSLMERHICKACDDKGLK